jgi:hypothetical protein
LICSLFKPRRTGVRKVLLSGEPIIGFIRLTLQLSGLSSSFLGRIQAL